MRKTLMATAAALALGFSGYAMANPCSGDKACQNEGNGNDSVSATATSTQTTGTGSNANEVSGKVAQDSWNSTKVIAATETQPLGVVRPVVHKEGWP